MKGIAEGTYNTKHAEAARLYYTTILLCYYTTTLALKSSGSCSPRTNLATARLRGAGRYRLQPEKHFSSEKTLA